MAKTTKITKTNTKKVKNEDCATNGIVHFEIPADNIERAKEFYTTIFGWQINKYEMGKNSGHEYYGVRTTPVDDKMMPIKPGAINGGMMKRVNPGQPFMNYIHVEDIDKMLKTIVAKGGKICLPKQEIGKSMGWIACFQDTEGNLMGLHQMGEK